jgi:hypothetical protein
MPGIMAEKMDPEPGVLATWISPPIIWQSLRLIARPNPFPP